MTEQSGFSDTGPTDELAEFGEITPLLTENGEIDRSHLNPSQIAAIEAGPGWVTSPAQQDQFDNPVQASLIEYRLFHNFPNFFLPDEEGYSTSYIGGKAENIPPEDATPQAVGGGDIRRLLSPPYQRFAIVYPEFCKYMFNLEAVYRQKSHDVDWMLDNEEVRNQAIIQAYNFMAQLVDKNDPRIEVNASEGEDYDRRYLVR